MRIKRLGTFLIAGGVFSLPLLGVGPASNGLALRLDVVPLRFCGT
jgi:hypothetical protein